MGNQGRGNKGERNDQTKEPTIKLNIHRRRRYAHLLAPAERIVRVALCERARARVDDLGARAVEEDVWVRGVHGFFVASCGF